MAAKVTFYAPAGTVLSTCYGADAKEITVEFGKEGQASFDADDPAVDVLSQVFVDSESNQVTTQPQSPKRKLSDDSD